MIWGRVSSASACAEKMAHLNVTSGRLDLQQCRAERVERADPTLKNLLRMLPRTKMREGDRRESLGAHGLGSLLVVCVNLQLQTIDLGLQPSHASLQLR
jgi:hypothetical protein